MTLEDVRWFLDLFEELGITAWVDGGWGVDALLGEQTRPHNDLDIVIEWEASAKLEAALRERGFSDVPTDDRRDWNFVLGNEALKQVDFHVIDIAEDGRGIYGPVEDNVFFPASALKGRGEIGGRPVMCMTAEFMMTSHTGYEIKATDLHDIGALHHRFGLPLPDEYVGRV